MVNTSSFIINYEGDIDKPLPKIIFCKDGHEIYDFRFYQFEMNNNFFKSTNTFISLREYNKEKNSADYISLLIGGENEKIFFRRKVAKLLIEELIKLSYNNKNKAMIYEQLSRYLAVINK